MGAGSESTSFPNLAARSCHDGQGRGLDQVDAHGEDEYWPTPMLGYTVQADWKKEIAGHLHGSEFMQANCAQCHKDKNFAATAARNARPRTFL